MEKNSMTAMRVLLIVPLLVLLTAVNSDAQPTAIVGATLIDGTGAAPVTDAVVLIDGRKIAAAGRRGQIHVPAGTKEIDGTGKFVIPGLMDANVHLVLGSSIEFVTRHEGRYEDLIEEAAQVCLKHGLTTVFDSWGPLQPLMNVRDRINRGETTGSRVFVAGNIVGFSGPFGRDFNANAPSMATRTLVERINRQWEENTGPDLLWQTPESVGAEIRKYVARGIDFLKYGASGHREENFLMFSPEQQRVIIDEVHHAGKIVQTHTTSVESVRQVLEAGVDMLQHGAKTGTVPMPDSTIRLMLAKKVYCAVQPRTKRRLEIEIKDAGEHDPQQRAAKERIRHENQIRLVAAGVPLLLATDAGMMDPDAAEAMKPELRIERLSDLGEGHYLWFEAMVEKGMTPMTAILSATRNIAAAYHKLDELGTVEKGKLADLVMLDADPLADIRNIRKIAMVIKDGQIVDRTRLPLKKVLSVSRSATKTNQ